MKLNLSFEVAKSYSSPSAGNPCEPPPASPKYDELKSVCGFKVCIVGFGGGAFWREVLSMVVTNEVEVIF